jgi:UDP-N-acetylmuramoyl-L-alanyl-D-glutamate--2,6-diaminopimelate ligase
MVVHGSLFAALPGQLRKGADYIPNAIALGAVAILAPTGTPRPADARIAFITHDEPRLLFAHLAAAFYEKQPNTMAAVTGTNGKTSTVQFIRQLWALAGHRAASLGTLGLIAPHITKPASMTTADTVSLHRDLAMLAENNITHCAFEASSHGLDQFRLHGCTIKAASLTNLTRDHLDYHQTMENYRAAKLRLFTEVLPFGAPAVLNADSDAFDWYAAALRERGIYIASYGTAGSDVQLLSVKRHGHGQHITLNVWGTRYDVDLPLIGQFQLENALCAAATAVAAGEPVARTIQNMAQLAPVRGRLEFIGSTIRGARVFVDYAHTPDGLSNVLTALRPYVTRSLHVVFGCGGDRDSGKRPLMGKIATALADNVIITDDNPRTENPVSIRAQIRTMAPQALEIADRATAIQTAINGLEGGDILVIAGKGHEQGQIVGLETLPFDDAEVARFALKTLAA